MSLLYDVSGVTRHLLATKQMLRPSRKDITNRVGEVIANTTIPYRYKGDLNTSMRKIATNLVLFPRMHFLNFFHSKNT